MDFQGRSKQQTAHAHKLGFGFQCPPGSRNLIQIYVGSLLMYVNVTLHGKSQYPTPMCVPLHAHKLPHTTFLHSQGKTSQSTRTKIFCDKFESIQDFYVPVTYPIKTSKNFTCDMDFQGRSKQQTARAHKLGFGFQCPRGVEIRSKFMLGPYLCI